MTTFWDKTELQRLEDFRMILVARRRQIVQSVFDLREANKETDSAAGANSGPEFRTIQDQIDAVDRAIDDEAKIEKGARAPVGFNRPIDYPKTGVV
jgi:hypothetical protein